MTTRVKRPWPFARKLERLFPTMFGAYFYRGNPVVDLLWHTDPHGRLIDFDEYCELFPTGDPEHEHSTPTFYADDGRLAGSYFGGKDRPCPACGHRATEPGSPEPGDDDQDDGWETPDPCLGWLPGVRAACCGHGGPAFYSKSSGLIVDRPYIVMADHRLVTGRPAIDEMHRLGGMPAPWPPGADPGCTGPEKQRKDGAQ
jgi:hypothetical protein